MTPEEYYNSVTSESRDDIVDRANAYVYYIRKKKKRFYLTTAFMVQNLRIVTGDYQLSNLGFSFQRKLSRSAKDVGHSAHGRKWV